MIFRPFVRHAIAISALGLFFAFFLVSCHTSAPGNPAPRAEADGDHDEGPHLLRLASASAMRCRAMACNLAHPSTAMRAR